MTADLLPCPFCGGKNMRYEPTEQSIFCIRCGATGPYKHFPYSPDEIWNTRHEPDELPEWVKYQITLKIGSLEHILRTMEHATKTQIRRQMVVCEIEALKTVLSLRKPE